MTLGGDAQCYQVTQLRGCVIYLWLVPHGLLEVALGEELGVDELGGLLRVGPVLGLRSIGPLRRCIEVGLEDCENECIHVPCSFRMESASHFTNHRTGVSRNLFNT